MIDDDDHKPQATPEAGFVPPPEDGLAHSAHHASQALEAAELAKTVNQECGHQVAQLEADNARLREDYLRALADAQNVQARADRRIESNTRYAIANFAKDIVAVADNLQRALQHVPVEARTTDEHLNALATGVEMTEKLLLSILERNGLKRVESLDRPFDPNLHQAMQEFEDKTVPTGTILQVFQEGYLLHDRLVRPAMVVISSGGPKRAAAAPTTAPEPKAETETAADEDQPGSRIDTSI